MGYKSKKCNCSIKPIEYKRDNEYEVRDGILYRRDKPYGVCISMNKDLDTELVMIEAVLIGMPGEPNVGVIISEQKIE